MTTKFTTDGRKVVIVGNLNSQEIIVQEVFVSANGAEIPSGENFVVKSLHDEPVKSWKIKNVEDEEKDVSSRMAEVNHTKEAIKHEQKRLNAIFSALKKYKTEDQFYPAIDTIAQFMTGGITHLVETEWNCRILDFSKAISPGVHDSGDLKLVSLFGGSNGDVTWRLHTYSDHSGGSKTVVPATSYAHAVSIVSDYVNAKEKVSSYDVKAAKDYGFEIDADKLKRFLDEEIAQKEKSVTDQRQKLGAALLELEGMKSEANPLNT